MNESAITLLKSRPSWKGVRWQRGAQIRRVDNLEQIVRAMSNVSIAAASIARIIIEEPIDGTEFLNLISNLPPVFLGDILLIATADRAFLSSHFEGGGRLSYAMTADDVDRYADAYGLRDIGAHGEPPKPERLRILVAEDERKTREFLVSILSKIGCETTVAQTGFEAVKVAQE